MLSTAEGPEGRPEALLEGLMKLQEKINIYQEDRTQLIPDFEEVSACQQLAAETADMFKQHIPDLTS